MLIKKGNKGFSLVEILIVVAIFSALLGYSVINLFGSKEKSDISTSLSLVVSDIKNQQQSAISGNEGNESFGIYFDTNNYVLFKGDTYNISDTGNFTVNLSDNVVLDSVNFQDNVLIFSKGSGEVYNFDPLNNSFKLKNTTDNLEKTIYINKYGSISIL